MIHCGGLLVEAAMLKCAQEFAASVGVCLDDLVAGNVDDNLLERYQVHAILGGCQE